MKYIVYLLLVLAVASMVFNTIQLDFSNLLEGNSQIAIISIFAALCVAVLMVIMIMAYRIQDKQNEL
jgi:uncharacterized integral membrane protein